MKPTVRIGVDWDGDDIIDYDDLADDPLNTFPDDAILRDDQSMSVGGATWAVIKDDNDYSPFCYQITAGGAGTRGIAFSTQSNWFATAKTTASVFEHGSLQLDAGTYTLSVMVKRVTSDVTLTLEVYDETEYEVGGGFSATASQSATADWARLNLTFTVPSGGRYLHISLTQASSLDFKVAYRASLVSGSSALAKFNDGTRRLYDDITADVEAFRCNSGRQNPDDPYPSDGRLTVTLKNFDRKYSPEYAYGPLYGQFKKNRKIVVEALHPLNGEYVTVWSGWTAEYKVVPGASGTRQATIEAEQGLFRLKRLKPTLGILTDIRFDELLDRVLEFGWQSTAGLLGVGDKSRWDKTMYFGSLDDVRTADTGRDTFPVVGDGYNENSSGESMLQEMLEIERGYFYIERGGKLRFRHRHTYRSDTAVADTIDIDGEARKATYEYGGDVRNVIKVGYFPKDYVDGSIWTTKEPLLVAGQETKTFDVEFEYEEGTKVSVSALLPFQVGASTVSAASASGTAIPSTQYTITTELKNAAGSITITNKGGIPAYFTIDLHGTKLVSYGNQVYTAQLEDYSTQYESLQDEGVSVRDVRNRLVTTEDAAIGIGDYLLARYALPRSSFRTVSFMNRTETWLARQLDIAIGSYIELSEYQTAFTQKVVVVGESHEYRPGVLDTTFTVTAPEFYTVDILTESDNSFYVGY